MRKDCSAPRGCAAARLPGCCCRSCARPGRSRSRTPGGPCGDCLGLHGRAGRGRQGTPAREQVPARRRRRIGRRPAGTDSTAPRRGCVGARTGAVRQQMRGALQHRPHGLPARLREAAASGMQALGESAMRRHRDHGGRVTACALGHIALEALADGNHSRKRRVAAPATLSGRVHVPVQMAQVPECRSDLLSTC